jgi:hypothetical protein
MNAFKTKGFESDMGTKTDIRFSTRPYPRDVEFHPHKMGNLANSVIDPYVILEQRIKRPGCTYNSLSTGIGCIIYFLNRQNVDDELHIINFDHQLGKKVHYYDNVKSDTYSHNFEEEKIIIQEWIDKGLISRPYV